MATAAEGHSIEMRRLRYFDHTSPVEEHATPSLRAERAGFEGTAVGENIAQAYRRLYLLERVCRAQLIAMSSGRELALLSAEIIAQVQSAPVGDSHERGEREQLFFAAMKRLLDRDLPGYAD